nr:PBP1A family penicillin-binding protein [Vibrio sp. S9_S30]
MLIFSLVCTILGVTTIIGFYFYVKPELPDVATLKDVELQTPMQVYSQDGKLISQFGEKRRVPVSHNDIPQELINALIATEDSRFFDHPGIDPIGIVRAAIVVATTGSAKQGASTITQQLARNFFLTNEKKIMRKIKEIFIAIHIEQLLTKEEILELYINKIFLGYRSYGFGAAAQVYFGKELNDLSLSELATLAGMPKAPSSINPIRSIERATNRRNVVLMRMLDEKYITQEQYDSARSEAIVAKYHGAEIELNAPYVAEIARSWALENYGEDAYTSGMKIYTTVNSKLQQAANEATINNLLSYDERHGYRGAEETLWASGEVPWTEDKMSKHLLAVPTYGELIPAIVTEVGEKSAKIYIKNQSFSFLDWDAMKWARPFKSDNRQGSAPSKATDILSVGEQIWVRKLSLPASDDQLEQQWVWKLAQVPDANTAFVAMNPNDGAIVSLVGGFNFVHSKFNRATQSVRQVGSSIKPFIYSAAIDQGMTLASLINDAPINKWDQSQGTAWRPKNSPPTYTGPTRMRVGLAQSKNVMAVRILRRVGLDESIDYLARFGFEKDQLPRSETLALGAGSLTPVKMAQGYSVFANGGYFVEPYYISRVEDAFGKPIIEAQPKMVCRTDCQAQEDNEFEEQDVDSPYAPQVISEQTAFLMREMMYSNVWGGGDWSKGTGWNGTGWRAKKLGRRDIGGKTGTTNDSKDAWYNGYAPGMVAIAWVGFDNHQRELGASVVNPNLGKDQITGAESGAKTAQPAWVNFMKVALEEVPAERKKLPEGIIRTRIDAESGLLTNKSDDSTMFEYFKRGTEPKEYARDPISEAIYSEDGEELF